MPQLTYTEATWLVFLSVLCVSGGALFGDWIAREIAIWRARRAFTTRSRTEICLTEILFYRGRR